jgi:glycosyltransferase involved in cell wall biosynthesis/multidrug transporter EmrE-like cation transporter
MSDLLLLMLNVAWAALTLVFLTAAGRIYLHREELPALNPHIALPMLSIIIPARDEAANIGDCLQCITRLDYPEGALEVVVVDDDSGDSTVSIVEEYSARDPRIRLVSAGPLPEGWMGKSHACWQGAQAVNGEWLLFIDADTRVKPPAARSALEYALSEGREFLSVIPFQLIVSPQERIVLPGVFLRFAAAIDFKRVNDPEDDFAIANGQFLLFSKNAYRRIGGHRAIRAEVSDDLAFARTAKQHRVSAYTLFGERQIETRMYRSVREIWNGFSKNAAEIMHATSAARIFADASISFGLAAGTLLPIVTFFGEHSGDSPFRSLSYILCLATLATLASFLALALRALRVPIIYVIATPLGLVMHGAITINAYFRKNTGSRQWKGRRY